MSKLILSVLLAAALLSASCGKKSVPTLEYMPDMYRSPAMKAQELDPHTANGVGMKTPPVGAVPVDFEPYPYGMLDTAYAHTMVNPLTPTKDVLEAGRKYYNTFCIVCHGVLGDGRGYIVPKFTQPPSLLSDKVRNWPDGRIYHVATVGQGLMPSYKQQVPSDQRWAIIHYLRALQRAAAPTPDDTQSMAAGQYKFEDDAPDTVKTVVQPKR